METKEMINRLKCIRKWVHEADEDIIDVAISAIQFQERVESVTVERIKKAGKKGFLRNNCNHNSCGYICPECYGAIAKAIIEEIHTLYKPETTFKNSLPKQATEKENE